MCESALCHAVIQASSCPAPRVPDPDTWDLLARAGADEDNQSIYSRTRKRQLINLSYSLAAFSVRFTASSASWTSSFTGSSELPICRIHDYSSRGCHRLMRVRSAKINPFQPSKVRNVHNVCTGGLIGRRADEPHKLPPQKLGLLF